MEKETEPLISPETRPRFPLCPESAPSKKVQILSDLDAAIKAFESMEEEGPVEFILREPASFTVPAPAVAEELPPPAESMEPAGATEPAAPVEPAVALPPIPSDGEIQTLLMRNALLLIDAGEYGLARNVLGDILRKNNNSVDAIRWMGWCFRQEGQQENALKCYEQLTQLRVTEQDLFELGEIYYALQRDSEAQAAWVDALGQCDAESPRLFDLHKNLGNVLARQGDYDGAEENYFKALTIRPQSDVIQVNLGSLHLHRQNYKSAMEFFKRALEVNAYNDKAWCGVALVARSRKDCDWAWAVLQKALDLNAYNQTALQVLVEWAQEDCRWDAAIPRVQAYVDRFQDDADSIYALAGLLYQKGDLAASEMELVRLEALRPERPEIPELRGLIQQKRELETGG